MLVRLAGPHRSFSSVRSRTTDVAVVPAEGIERSRNPGAGLNDAVESTTRSPADGLRIQELEKSNPDSTVADRETRNSAGSRASGEIVAGSS